MSATLFETLIFKTRMLEVCEKMHLCPSYMAVESARIQDFIEGGKARVQTVI